MKKHIRLTGISLVIVIFDQITKYVILQSLQLHHAIPVIPNFFNIVHIQNPGGAFGLFADQHVLIRGLVFIVFSFVAMGIVLYLYLQTPENQPWLLVGLAMIFGGAIGNMIDRLRYGKVVDFLDFYIGTFHWPAFNVADSAISIGMVIFGFYILFHPVTTAES
ncbi:MAG: signal peptidase II [Desulfobacterales bacterium]|nr:signal peptidase II [Desulfobacterales bacterium]